MIECLKKYKDLVAEIEFLYLQIKYTKLELEQWEQHENPNEDKYLARNFTYHATLQKQSELRKALKKMNETLSRKEKQKKEVLQLIDKFEGLENEVLRLRYIENLSLSEIAMELHYSEQHIRRVHANLVRMIQFRKM
ncbi:Sigma-70, region 4 [Pilibacter termitis]|uniref:Sigma-70, region 4 n=1 Tax=Pilibacter termitis TaxID=263852 RepID=A0A1T4RDB0_9ENTE|nr:sigma factor-like helix-turn-helix DNA-binding protein [Pilibacter termitis]SKA13889.1 Sigma-70, region 4 [Pilibacter termitis]